MANIVSIGFTTAKPYYSTLCDQILDGNGSHPRFSVKVRAIHSISIKGWPSNNPPQENGEKSAISNYSPSAD